MTRESKKERDRLADNEICSQENKVSIFYILRKIQKSINIFLSPRAVCKIKPVFCSLMVLASIFLETLILLGGTLMGKKGHDLPKNLRQELVLNIVENFAGSDGILTSDVFELLDNKCPGVNRRTLYRDLQELSTRYPIYDETIDGKTKWFVENESRSAIMNSLYREYIQKELVEFLKKETELELTPAI